MLFSQHKVHPDNCTDRRVSHKIKVFFPHQGSDLIYISRMFLLSIYTFCYRDWLDVTLVDLVDRI